MSLKIYRHRAAEVVDISDFSPRHSWYSSTGQAAAQASVDIAINKTDSNLVNVGDVISISDEKQAFIGMVLDKDPSIDEGIQYTLTAYDALFYLINNEDDLIFYNLTADGVLRKVCGDNGIPVGKIVSTGYVIPRLNCRSKSLFQMVTEAIAETKKYTGKDYFIRSSAGKIDLIAVSTTATLTVEEGVNIISGSCRYSASNMRNKIKVVKTQSGEDSPATVLAVVKNDALIQKYGSLQRLITLTNDSKENPNTVANNELAEKGRVVVSANVQVIGDTDYVAGDCVNVKMPSIGIQSVMRISSANHQSDGGLYTTVLNLERV